MNIPPVRAALLRSMGCFVVVLVAGPLAAPAEEAKRQPPPAEASQFDFWVGDWEVTTPGGKVAGTNRIEKILDGRVLQENWTGAGGVAGKSFNIFDTTVGKWRQF